MKEEDEISNYIELRNLRVIRHGSMVEFDTFEVTKIELNIIVADDKYIETRQIDIADLMYHSVAKPNYKKRVKIYK